MSLSMTLKRRESLGASSGGVPSPRVVKSQKKDMAMTLTAVPFGKNGQFQSDVFGPTVVTAWVLETNSTTTKLYDLNPLFTSFLASQHRENKDLPKDIEDLSNYGMLWASTGKPHWYRILFTDDNEAGFQNGFLILRNFLQVVATSAAHGKRLAGLKLKVHNQTTFSTEGFATMDQDKEKCAGDGITIQIVTDAAPCIHPTELKHPDRRGFPTLLLQPAPPDFDMSAELNGEAFAEAKAGKVVMIPQYQGAWFHLRTILRESGFEDMDPTSNAGKTWQAPAITETSGVEWLQGFLDQLEELPLLACVPKNVPKLEALLTKPWTNLTFFPSDEV